MSKIKHSEAIAITSDETKQALETLGAVNLDEVLIETITVKVRTYKEESVFDDDGNPVLDDDDTPLTYRKPSTRTARIQNFVPVPVYHRMIALRDELSNAQQQKQLEIMADLVLGVWQVTEPWMTKKMLSEGVDFSVIGALFTRFFNTSRLQKNKA